MTVTVTRVEDGLLRLHCRSWRGAAVGYDVSAYVMRDVLVDTGFPRVSADFVRAVREVAPRGAIVTHQHEDHAGSAAALASLGLPMIMHSGCAAVLRERPPIGFYRRAIWGRPARLAVTPATFDAAPLAVLPLAGHTADHLGVWDAERGILASGDLFLGVKVRIAHHGESPAVLVASLRRAAALEPRLLLDAHRGPVEAPTPLLRAKADWLEEIIGDVARLAREGLPEREITRRTLGGEELVGRISGGEYSKRSLVQAVLREHAPGR